MGKIITVGLNQKGGVGKSTIATNIAVDLARNRPDLNIRVFDTDVELTASMDFFEERMIIPSIKCSVIEHPEELEEVISFVNASDKNIAIIDNAGMSTEVTESSVAITDLLFIPFRMSSKDLKALGLFIESINKANGRGSTIESFLVPNYIYANAHVSKVKNKLKPLIESGFKFGSGIKTRNSYTDSAEVGKSALEYGDIKAGKEIFYLVEEISKRV